MRIDVLLLVPLYDTPHEMAEAISVSRRLAYVLPLWYFVLKSWK